MNRITVALLGAMLGGVACGSDGANDSAEISCEDPNAPTYETFGRALLEEHCTSCHSSENTGAARNGAPPGYNFDTLEGVMAYADSIREEVSSGGMPPGPNKPSEAQIKTLNTWIECGPM